MRRIFQLLCVLLLVPLALAAQTSLSGDWEGKLALPMGKLRLILHLTEEAGRWSASLDSPDQGAYALRADEVEVRGDSLFLRLNALHLRYTALRDGEDQLVGTFEQGGMSLPLSLRRVAKAEDTKPAPTTYTEEELTIPVSGSSIVLSGSLALPKEGKASYPTLGMRRSSVISPS